MENVIDQYHGRNFSFYNGDSCEILKMLPTESVHFSIFSPPFMDLYTYSDSDRDIGNCHTPEEFDEHMGYIARELYRVLKQGRLVAVHCMILPAQKFKDGFIGAKDFPGELIRLFEKEGFIFHSEICIWKNPVTAMQRTKALGLLHKQIKFLYSASKVKTKNPLQTQMKRSLLIYGNVMHRQYGWTLTSREHCRQRAHEMKKMKSIYALCNLM